MRAFPLLLVGLLIGCGSETSDPGSDSSSDTASASVSVPADLDDRPCDLLPLEDAASILGVEAGAIEQMDIVGTCTYSAEAGDFADLSVTVNTVEVYETPEEAAESFTLSYREITAEEAAQAAEAIGRQIDQQEADGEITAGQADDADALGGLVSGLAAQTEYESIEGIGERAMYDGTEYQFGSHRTVESTLYVQSGNLVFGVNANLFQPTSAEESMAGPDEAAIARNREASIESARAILANVQ
ncbi:MAG: hypothetical protein AAGI52_15275 [Bacteroidota bacterium]